MSSSKSLPITANYRISNIQMFTLNSSFIQAVGLEQTSGTVVVEMKNGAIYQYSGAGLVARFAEMLTAHSPGKVFQALVRESSLTVRVA